MALSQENRPSASGFFVITPYSPVADVHPVADIPDTCPLNSIDKPTCQIAKHHLRNRKTGPGFPLLVVTCHVHKKSFTLYPPGFAPYRRQPVIRQTLTGETPAAEKENHPEEEAGIYEATVFQAAFDAKAGKAWARNSLKSVPELWWSTQRRHLQLGARLVGVSQSLNERLRETIARALSVDHLRLRELLAKTAPGFRHLGLAICEVLKTIHSGATRAMRLLFSGHASGQWALPWKWDSGRKVLERLPFRSGGIAAPT
jgi:hypothetical protein